jgi:transmembrane sensor
MRLKTPKHSARFLDEVAADWVARMDAGALTPAQEEELQEWLDSDARCLGAFARARAIFLSPGLAAAMPTVTRPPVRNLIASPLARRGFLAAAALGLAGSAFLLGRREQGEKRVYASELGEVRQIPLEDGSRITLNTNSAVKVEYRKESRLVVLQRGEAYFEVAKNSERPFIVVGSSAQARAVGTAYSVRLGEEAGQMQIRVASGRVAVEAPQPQLAAPFAAIRSLFGSKSANGAYLNANQEAEVRVAKDGPDKGEIQVSIRDLQPGIFERSLMWREGMLSFEGVTLADAIAEFARYSRQKILIRGALAHERVSGLFAAADPAAFARAVAISLKIKITAEEDALVLYRP